jgi:hypothetical protein
MFYLDIIKRMSEDVKNNADISEEDKAKAKLLLGELSNLLAMY